MSQIRHFVFAAPDLLSSSSEKAFDIPQASVINGLLNVLAF